MYFYIYHDLNNYIFFQFHCLILINKKNYYQLNSYIYIYIYIFIVIVITKKEEANFGWVWNIITRESQVKKSDIFFVLGLR